MLRILALASALALPAIANPALNNRVPGLIPPAGTAWRGAELGADNRSAAVFNKKYGQPLHIWRTFGGNVTAEMRTWIEEGGILWFNFAPKATSWRDIAAGAIDDRLVAHAQQVRSVSPAQVFVCPFHEPDHHVSPSNGNSFKDYRQMYWHVQSVFKAHGATNAVWVMDYSVQIAYKTGANVMPLWPGNDAVDWLFFNIFEKKSERRDGRDYATVVRHVVKELSRNATAELGACARGCKFTAKPWGLGAFGAHDDVAAADRAAFLREAKAGMPDLPLSAYLYFDALESAVAPGAMQEAFEAFLGDAAFAKNDAGAPPL